MLKWSTKNTFTRELLKSSKSGNYMILLNVLKGLLWLCGESIMGGRAEAWGLAGSQCQGSSRERMAGTGGMMIDGVRFRWWRLTGLKHGSKKWEKEETNQGLLVDPTNENGKYSGKCKTEEWNQELYLGPGRIAQLVRLLPDRTRLWVWGLVRAHTRINQWMHKCVEQ